MFPIDRYFKLLINNRSLAIKNSKTLVIAASVFASVDYNLDDLDSQTLQRIRNLFSGKYNTFEVLNTFQVALSRLGRHCTNLSKKLRATSTFN